MEICRADQANGPAPEGSVLNGQLQPFSEDHGPVHCGQGELEQWDGFSEKASSKARDFERIKASPELLRGRLYS